jgi:hypothetical protein
MAHRKSDSRLEESSNSSDSKSRDSNGGRASGVCWEQKRRKKKNSNFVIFGSLQLGKLTVIAIFSCPVFVTFAFSVVKVVVSKSVADVAYERN